MNCIYCEGSCYKNGYDRKREQRYKCLRKGCGKSFTRITQENLIISKKKFLVLQLILSGCPISAIAKNLRMTEGVIKKWKKLHLKNLAHIPRRKFSTNVRRLIKIYGSVK